MGYYKTLHFFNFDKFQTEVIPYLRGEKGSIKKNYLFFQEKKNLNFYQLNNHEKEERTAKGINIIHEISNDIFPNNASNQPSNDYQISIEKVKKYETNSFIEEYNAFFEMIVFMKCADYLPYFVLGKNSIHDLFDSRKDTLSQEILNKIEGSYTKSFFSIIDYLGIIGWVSNEDVKLLLGDNKKLATTNALTSFFEIASEMNYGVIHGVDMRIFSKIKEINRMKLLDEKQLEYCKQKNEYLIYDLDKPPKMFEK